MYVSANISSITISNDIITYYYHFYYCHYHYYHYNSNHYPYFHSIYSLPRFIDTDTLLPIGTHFGKEALTVGQGARVGGSKEKYFITSLTPGVGTYVHSYLWW